MAFEDTLAEFATTVTDDRFDTTLLWLKIIRAQTKRLREPSAVDPPAAPTPKRTPRAKGDSGDELADVEAKVKQLVLTLDHEQFTAFEGGLLANFGTGWDQRPDWPLGTWRGALKLLQPPKK